ncbi:hypothetical protein GCM10011314_33870 [Knoellia flava]|uniref:Uncharacterized protein n=1 Tax=Knoellia flava TaxID=913969 RepID=A0A8H9FXD2_9MICO|nr:hypothetical protein GCM10011314_33870 [Knoellia flava]
MRQLGEAALAADEHSGTEGPQLKGIEVHPPANRRVRRVEHLEPSVKEETIYRVGALAAADCLRRLDDDDRAARLRKPPSAAEAREPSTHHDHLGVHHGCDHRRRTFGVNVC